MEKSEYVVLRFRAQLAGKYVELVETLTGEVPNLVPGDTRSRIEKSLIAKGYLPK